MTIIEALNVIYAQIETDLNVALPELKTVIYGDITDDVSAPYAVVRLSVENLQEHALDGSQEFDAVFSITVSKKREPGTVAMEVKISDSKEVCARLKATRPYAGVATMTSIDGIDYSETDDALVDSSEFTVTVRFMCLGFVDG